MSEHEPYVPNEWEDGENKFNITDQDGNIVHQNVKVVYVGTGGSPVSAQRMNKLETQYAKAKELVDEHKAEDASTTKKGHVQLSSAVDSISESLAATSKAVKTAYDKANEKPFVVGTYTGDDTASRTIVLGFRPSAVFLENKSGVHDMGRYGGFALDGYPTVKWNTSYEYLTIVSNGFTVYFDSDNQIATNDDNPLLNPYRYIAYK